MQKDQKQRFLTPKVKAMFQRIQEPLENNTIFCVSSEISVDPKGFLITHRKGFGSPGRAIKWLYQFDLDLHHG